VAPRRNTNQHELVRISVTAPDQSEVNMPHDDEADRAERWYERKSRLMERWLGTEHDMVMHAIIPYGVGGSLDLYYFPNGIRGTAIATKELCELPGDGSRNECFDCYELVMFTRHTLDLDAAHDDGTPFGRAHLTMSAILNCIAPYSAEASLNPGETCEFPEEMERIGGKCLIFDDYGSCLDDDAGRFGLLAIIEVHRIEMDFARENGSDALFDKLRAAGCYPYSDLDREPVV
jgi:hypothetical protein